jgi:AraC-like DNA-binding protein/ketosteroid isomerase-like protein
LQADEKEWGWPLDLEEFVDSYISAWNRRDLAGLLEHFCDDGAVFDAFWMETCVGEDLLQYFESVIEEERHWLQRVGDVIPMDGGVICRYGAYEVTESGPDQLVFNGAEVMTLRDGKIATISDFYCDPTPAALEEVAKWAARHHGRLRALGSGLPAVKATQFRDKLYELIIEGSAFLDPNLTATEVADRIGCSVDHLNQVVIAEMGASFYSFLDKHRAQYARQLLLEASDDPDYVYDVSTKAGFRSFESFVRSFDRFFNTRPEEFYRENSK